jgi:VanZ family protein
MLHIMHVAIRKMAEFGLLSAAVLHGARTGRNGWRLRSAVAALVIAAAYAGLDEWYQSFVPLRNVTPRDAAVEAFRTLLAQYLVWGYATRRWPFTVFLKRLPG